MLTKRIIPCLDVKEGRVVKGVQFVSLRDAGDPVELAKFYNEQGADELVFLDISATNEGRETMVDVVRETAAALSIPFTVGGGIRTLDDMKRMLRAGADKVSVNSAALQNPQLIQQGSDYFGAQCIVVAIDAKWSDEDQTWMIYTHGGREKFPKSAVAWAKEAVALGAGELLVTSMDQDGEKKGFDQPLLAAIREAVNVPVIASGGAGNAQHFYDVLVDTDADAALAASIFHYKETSVAEVKQFLKEKGVPVR